MDIHKIDLSNNTDDIKTVSKEDESNIQSKWKTKAVKDKERNIYKITKLLYRSDGEIARLNEDIVNILIEKNLLSLNDLPLVTQQLLIKRQELRAELQTENKKVQ